MQAFPMGGVITLVVLLPNLLAVFFPPASSPADSLKPVDPRLQRLTVIERVGQAGCFVLPFFYQVDLRGAAAAAALAVMAVCLLVYYAGWVRYIKLGRAEALFYRPLLGIPLPMAVMPVIYFFAAGVLVGSIWLMLAAVVLGAGHIPVSWLSSRAFE